MTLKTSSLTIEHALLGFLRGQPKHGYAIHQELTDSAGLGPVWQIKLSQLYALLDKLESAAYVFTVTEPQENKPPRKLFHLTAVGEAAFLAWVESPVAHGRSLRLEFLVKLYFARREGTDVESRLLAAQRVRCQEWLAAQESRAAGEAQNAGEYGRLVHQFRLGQIQAMLDWLNSFQE
ncbi:MAG: PadR family transcriptional regulator [Chloroflexi bacterium]|nr:PadR family transcriptional regulator [Chloroflexota bacterium]